ncbi:hypothetical protein [Streptomyces sp. NPDC002855]|uniref:hypothetical protein n=1 Tax=Streptomyces sp. NPDC002855 TaxID=3154437 RepID=UPI0033272646
MTDDDVSAALARAMMAMRLGQPVQEDDRALLAPHVSGANYLAGMSDYGRLNGANLVRNLKGCRVEDLDEGLSQQEAQYAATQYQAMGYGCVALPEEDGDPETFWRVYSDRTRAEDVTDHALAVLP